MLKRIIYSFFFIIIVTGLDTVTQAETGGFAVIPFQIHADRDLDFLTPGITDMLLTRLKTARSPVVVVQDATQAAKASARYLVKGSVTVLEDAVSTSAECIRLADQGTVTVFSETGEKPGDVIKHVDQFASGVLMAVMARRPADNAEAAGLVNDVLGENIKTRPQPAATSSKPAAPVTRVWRSSVFNQAYTALAAGDIDGDGYVELVALGKNRIEAFRFVSNRLKPLSHKALSDRRQYIWLDVGDIDQDGVAEIFVTGFEQARQKPDAMVFDYKNGLFVLRQSGKRMYWRALKTDNGSTLLGQRRGDGTPFKSTLTTFAWNGADYVPVAKTRLPSGVDLFGFTQGRLLAADKAQTAALTANGHLNLYIAGSLDPVWISADRYTSGGVYLAYPSTQFETNPEDGPLARYYLPQRLHLTDFDGDGENEIIMAANVDRSGHSMVLSRFFKEGRVLGLGWDGLGMAAKWQTQALTGHVADTALADVDADGQTELVAVVIPSGNLSFQNDKSYIVIWDAAAFINAN